MKSFRLWFWIAVALQFINAAIHSISLFVTPQPGNETERRLFELLDTYRFDMGAGFTPTMGNLLMALSSCFTLLFAFAGLVNAMVLVKRADDVVRGLLLINVVIFGVCFAIMAVLTFLPPIVLTGLIFTLLVLTLVLQRTQSRQ